MVQYQETTEQAGSAATQKLPIELVVHAKTVECEGVVVLDLRPADGGMLAPFAGGAHIKVQFADADGLSIVRHYSLCNDPSERHRYVVGVGLSAESRGGSHAIHTHLQQGDTVRADAPRNHFPLREDAPHSILIGGGIGVTPLLAMARRLATLGRAWTLYLCAATPRRAAFLDEARSLPGGTVVPVFDGMPGIARLDLPAVAARAPADTHLYCCGPAPMMDAFVAACAGRKAETVHLEWFAPSSASASAEAAVATPFVVRLARSGRTLNVPTDKSILDVVLDAGVAAPYVCGEGVCGSCEVNVLAGEPWHRDALLAGECPRDRMMICVSRTRGEELTLDL